MIAVGYNLYYIAHKLTLLVEDAAGAKLNLTSFEDETLAYNSNRIKDTIHGFGLHYRRQILG